MCNIEKLIDKFYKKGKGYNSRCKSCVSLYNKQKRDNQIRVCKLGYCNKKVRSKELCAGHLKQLSSGYDLTPLRDVRKKGSSEERNSLGEKFCTKCEYWLHVIYFGQCSTTTDKLRSSCKKCHAIEKYGLNARSYEDLLQSQGGKCAVCDEQLSQRKTCVDHDHSCCPGFKSCGKCVRGILCYNCNTADGLLKSDPEIIKKLLNYIEKHQIMEET